MLYVIGLGLGNAKGVTMKGLEMIKKCDRVYLEEYASTVTIDKEKLEEFYDCEIIAAYREVVESTDEILEEADHKNVAFLVIGDPFDTTIYTDLILRAKEKNIKVEVVRNVTLVCAVSCCGLQLYHYGEVVTIPFWTETWQPDSFFDKIVENYKRGLHTLCLLDIKVKEPTLESSLKKKIIDIPPKFMSVAEAADQLLQIIEKKSKNNTDILPLTPSNLAVGFARVGSDDQQVIACSLSKMKEVDLGSPLHCLVIPGNNLHPLELEYLLEYALDKSEFQELAH